MKCAHQAFRKKSIRVCASARRGTLLVTDHPRDNSTPVQKIPIFQTQDPAFKPILHFQIYLGFNFTNGGTLYQGFNLKP